MLLLVSGGPLLGIPGSGRLPNSRNSTGHVVAEERRLLMNGGRGRAFNDLHRDGDANGDLSVDFDDITAVFANWGADFGSETGEGAADDSGLADFEGITSVPANFGAICDWIGSPRIGISTCIGSTSEPKTRTPLHLRAAAFLQSG